MKMEGWINGQRKHGDSGSHYIYRIWCGMKTRCYNKNRTQYKDWGGRGIGIFVNWIYDYELFKKYILDNLGDKPTDKHQLDRIDNDLGYYPNNLRWATRSEQNYNRRVFKLSEEDVREILWLLCLEYTQQSISEDYNVSRGTISDIKLKRRHKNVLI